MRADAPGCLLLHACARVRKTHSLVSSQGLVQASPGRCSVLAVYLLRRRWMQSSSAERTTARLA
jgi:hypothetical protein